MNQILKVGLGRKLFNRHQDAFSSVFFIAGKDKSLFRGITTSTALEKNLGGEKFTFSEKLAQRQYHSVSSINNVGGNIRRGVNIMRNSRNIWTPITTCFTVLVLNCCVPSSCAAFVTSSSSHSSNQSFIGIGQKRSMSTTTASSSLKSTAKTVDSSASSSSSDVYNGVLDSILPLDNSWIKQLSSETEENLAKSRSREGLPDFDDNRRKRPVFNGHYVIVKPSGLKSPKLLLMSKDVASNLLNLSDEQIESDDLKQYLSGNIVLEDSSTWATPYALSIMGTRYTNNCPYGTGNGYGDGRAISIGEFSGHELQLKGAGTTPFHRGADGRAVLRSSIREFLASELNHYLGVPTTRALSLIVSEGENGFEDSDTATRPWYSDDNNLRIPSLDDPRLAKYDMQKRKELINQLRNTQKSDPNIMIMESCAITCRVAPSFVRIGHIDLFSRRITQQEDSDKYDTTTVQWQELEQMIWHACYREYKETAYDPFIKSNDIKGASKALLEQAAIKLATMVSTWINVGFAQGNFNADNCLVGGNTMDYGPFGYMEEYNPVFAKWTGSGQHFGFMNQPNAGFANYAILASSVSPVISAHWTEDDKDTFSSDDEDEIMSYFMEKAKVHFEGKIDEVFCKKLGLAVGDDEITNNHLLKTNRLWGELESLMRSSRADWTILWRQLSDVMKEYPNLESDESFDDMLKVIENGDNSPFYEQLSEEKRAEWISWIEQWRKAMKQIHEDKDDAGQLVYESMIKQNPKYVLREWMLVDAYNKAGAKDYSELNNLYELIQRPYEEGTDAQIQKYYRRAPDEALTSGGTAFMS